MQKLETALKASFGNFFSAYTLSITTSEYDALQGLLAAIVQLVIAFATVISLFKKRQQNGKD